MTYAFSTPYLSPLTRPSRFHSIVNGKLIYQTVSFSGEWTEYFTITETEDGGYHIRSEVSLFMTTVTLSESPGGNSLLPGVNDVFGEGTGLQSNGGYNDEKWLATEIVGAFSNGTMVIDGAFNFVEHSKTGRFLANGYQHISKAEMAQTLKLAKPLTRGIAGVNLISQTISVADDFSHGRWKSGTTRGVVNGIILGVTAVNPLLGFGLGVAEALWGDYLYEYVEKNW